MTSPLEATRQAYPPRLRTLTVVSAEPLSPTMRRFVLTGEDLETGFPHAPMTTATHVKVVIPQETTGEVVLPVLGERGLVPPEGVELTIRDYTVRGFDPRTRLLSLDFVLHEHGPAGRWATGAEPGDRLGVLGPRGYTTYPSGYARYVLGADETALPAVERWIEEAPPAVRIEAFVLAPSASRRRLPEHPGLDLHWIEGVDGERLTQALIEATRFDDGHTFLWAAAESGAVAPLRRHLSSAGVVRVAFDVSGYWRIGRAGSGEHDETEGGRR